MKCKIESRSINILAFQGRIKLRFYKVVVLLIVPEMMAIGCEIGSPSRNIEFPHIVL